MIDSMEIRTPVATPVKAPRWGFFGLLLVGLVVLMLALIGQWLWLTKTLEAPDAQLLLPSERAPLINALFRQKAIVWSLVASAMTLVIAVIVAVLPLTWWLYLLAALGKAPVIRLAGTGVWSQAQQSAEEWVAAQIVLPPVEQAAEIPAGQSGVETTVLSQPGSDPALSQSHLQAQPEQDAQPSKAQPQAQPTQPPQPGTPQPPAQPGSPQAQAPQPGAQPSGAPPPPALQPSMQPAEAIQPGTPPPAAPPLGTPQPPAQPGLQQLLAPEENIDLKELTDIGDILSSFKDNEVISPYLLALSQSLDEIDITTLVTRSRRLADCLVAGSSLHSQVK